MRSHNQNNTTEDLELLKKTTLWEIHYHIHFKDGSPYQAPQNEKLNALAQRFGVSPREIRAYLEKFGFTFEMLVKDPCPDLMQRLRDDPLLLSNIQNMTMLERMNRYPELNTSTTHQICSQRYFKSLTEINTKNLQNKTIWQIHHVIKQHNFKNIDRCAHYFDVPLSVMENYFKEINVEFKYLSENECPEAENLLSSNLKVVMDLTTKYFKSYFDLKLKEAFDLANIDSNEVKLGILRKLGYNTTEIENRFQNDELKHRINAILAFHEGLVKKGLTTNHVLSVVSHKSGPLNLLILANILGRPIKEQPLRPEEIYQLINQDDGHLKLIKQLSLGPLNKTTSKKTSASNAPRSTASNRKLLSATAISETLKPFTLWEVHYTIKTKNYNSIEMLATHYNVNPLDMEHYFKVFSTSFQYLYEKNCPTFMQMINNDTPNVRNGHYYESGFDLELREYIEHDKTITNKKEILYRLGYAQEEIETQTFVNNIDKILDLILSVHASLIAKGFKPEHIISILSRKSGESNLRILVNVYDVLNRNFNFSWEEIFGLINQDEGYLNLAFLVLEHENIFKIISTSEICNILSQDKGREILAGLLNDYPHVSSVMPNIEKMSAHDEGANFEANNQGLEYMDTTTPLAAQRPQVPVQPTEQSQTSSTAANLGSFFNYLDDTLKSGNTPISTPLLTPNTALAINYLNLCSSPGEAPHLNNTVVACQGPSTANSTNSSSSSANVGPNASLLPDAIPNPNAPADTTHIPNTMTNVSAKRRTTGGPRLRNLPTSESDAPPVSKKRSVGQNLNGPSSKRMKGPVTSSTINTNAEQRLTPIGSIKFDTVDKIRREKHKIWRSDYQDAVEIWNGQRINNQKAIDFVKKIRSYYDELVQENFWDKELDNIIKTSGGLFKIEEIWLWRNELLRHGFSHSYIIHFAKCYGDFHKRKEIPYSLFESFGFTKSQADAIAFQKGAAYNMASIFKNYATLRNIGFDHNQIFGIANRPYSWLNIDAIIEYANSNAHVVNLPAHLFSLLGSMDHQYSRNSLVAIVNYAPDRGDDVQDASQGPNDGPVPNVVIEEDVENAPNSEAPQSDGNVDAIRSEPAPSIMEALSANTRPLQESNSNLFSLQPFSFTISSPSENLNLNDNVLQDPPIITGPERAYGLDHYLTVIVPMALEQCGFDINSPLFHQTVSDALPNSIALLKQLSEVISTAFLQIDAQSQSLSANLHLIDDQRDKLNRLKCACLNKIETLVENELLTTNIVSENNQINAPSTLFYKPQNMNDTALPNMGPAHKNLKL